MTTTVLGATGFIGRNLLSMLEAEGEECWAPEKGNSDIFRRPLGTVYYCVGLTSDFRTRPFDTVEAHVGLLQRILERSDFESLVYLSSTRVYLGCASAREDQALYVNPNNAGDLYNLSKLMGESLALSSGRPCKIARLSNVIGPDMGRDGFLGEVVETAVRTGRLILHTDLASEKDYIWVSDVVKALMAISRKGSGIIYNVAAGENVSHRDIVSLLEGKGVDVKVVEKAPVVSFPRISIDSLLRDIGVKPDPVLPRISEWLDSVFKKN